MSRRRPATVAQLSVNYRTPSEVMEVAVRVLASADPGLTAPTSVRSTGIPPRAVGVDGTDLATTVAEVARAEAAEVGGGTVAILCPDSWVGDLARDLAGAGLEFALGEVDGLDQAVTLLPVGVAKGLEFDSVVLVEPAAVLDDAVQGMRALYVALTRTTRRLTVVHSRPLPAKRAGLAGGDEAAAAAATGWGGGAPSWGPAATSSRARRRPRPDRPRCAWRPGATGRPAARPPRGWPRGRCAAGPGPRSASGRSATR